MKQENIHALIQCNTYTYRRCTTLEGFCWTCGNQLNATIGVGCGLFHLFWEGFRNHSFRKTQWTD
jgi:hypothetical protein